MSNLSTGKTLLKGSLPAGCNRVAQSNSRETLLYAVKVGNRATRREAMRKLAKQSRKK